MEKKGKTMKDPQKLDDFDTAYRAQVEENRPLMELMAAIIRLTDFGE